ncbi:response regulator transcription factor [Streptococcus sp. S784/96/1]|uniref:response regulator transcription factor n=1 Tax=Streptococcus sp. S784/96/1 TaxID=2653499 RepID=UPI001389BA6F|nr:response regulator transcription factor [Streptococcus sp. S784/96/1]
MYKLMIVDDEYMILEGMKRLFDYSALGIELVYTTDSSREALNYALTHDLDMILTDISMPDLTGLELIATIKERSPDVAFIIMSGFQEFDYARQAVSLGVKDYLVKPINKQELRQLLETIVAQRMHKSQQAQAFLRGDKVTIQDLKEQLRVSQVYVVVSREDIPTALVSVLRHVDQDALFFSLCEEPQQACIYQEELLVTSTMYAIKESVKASLFYEKAASADEQVMPVYQDLYPLIKTGDIQGILDQLPLLKQEFNDKCPPVHLTRQFFIQLMVDSYQQFNRISNEDIAPLYTNAKQCQTLEQLVEEVIQRLLGLITQHKYNSHVGQVLDIIRQEYQKELTLKLVSERLFLNAVYLGQIIKKETGSTFSELLNQERIRIAQSLLLSTNDNIEDICFQVGYTNIGYFYKIFKRLCQESPKSYREQIRSRKETSLS